MSTELVFHATLNLFFYLLPSSHRHLLFPLPLTLLSFLSHSFASINKAKSVPPHRREYQTQKEGGDFDNLISWTAWLALLFYFVLETTEKIENSATGVCLGPGETEKQEKTCRGSAAQSSLMHNTKLNSAGKLVHVSFTVKTRKIVY